MGLHAIHAEYAKSGRAACKTCKNLIGDKTLRLGFEEDSPFFDGTQKNWHHVRCAFTKAKQKNAIAAKIGSDATQIVGFSDLRWEDQQRLIKYACGADPETGDGAAGGAGDAAAAAPTESAPVETQKRKRGRGGKKEEKDGAHQQEAPKAAVAAVAKSAGAGRQESEAEKVAKALWGVKDALGGLVKSGELRKEQLKAICRANGQGEGNTESALIGLVADGLVFGRIPPCPVCKESKVVYEAGAYRCRGNVSEWTSCTWVGNEMERTDYTIPPGGGGRRRKAKRARRGRKKREEEEEEATEEEEADGAEEEEGDPVFDKVRKLAPKERLKPAKLASPLKHAAPGAGPAPSTSSSSSSLRGVLAGRVFAWSPTGLARDKAALQSVAALVGATVRESVGPRVDYLLVGNEYEAGGAQPSQVKTAAKYDVPLVKEAWLDAIVEAGALVERAPFTVSGPAADKPVEERQRARGREGEEEGRRRFVRKGRGVVDDDSGLVDIGHVFERGKDLFSATLVKADVAGTTGQNSFYTLQLIKHDKLPTWYVFKKWGRIGEEVRREGRRGGVGGTSVVEFAGAEEAVAEFERTFFDKTKNEWAARASFVKRAGHYNYIEVDLGGGDEAGPGATAAGAPETPSRLDPRVQDLMRLIFDTSMLTQTMVELELDTKKLPLGKLKGATIEAAYRVLGEIQALLAERDSPAQAGAGEAGARRGLEAVEVLLRDRSNYFYNLVPHAAPQRGQLPAIGSPEALQAKRELLDALKDIEIAQRLIFSGRETAAAPAAGVNVLDAYYGALKTELVPLERGGPDWDLLQHYLTNTHAATHSKYELVLLDAFTVAREGEQARFEASQEIENHALLWHGSRKANYPGILSQGLRIAPPEAPVTGYMFGKGIYFANMSSKSANYCYPSEQNNVGLVLLSEVALGRCQELTEADPSIKRPARGFHSVHGAGETTPDPAGERAWGPRKVRVPCGKGIESKVKGRTALLYDEFIVYDVAQVLLRFLLKIEFRYKTKSKGTA
eukprot:tig00001154_g7294.t2